MPSRTAIARKAVLQRWQQEYDLVCEGKGTRDWSREQQQDILENGLAHDEDGRAFEGHHMKSVEKYPLYQGDPGNIQFLSRSEHQAAHGGDFRLPTNGMYDYVSGNTQYFGDGIYNPCQVIELSNPVACVYNCDTETATAERSQIYENAKSGAVPLNTVLDQSATAKPIGERSTNNPPTKQTPKATVMDGIVTAANAVKDYADRHPVITSVVKIGSLLLGAYVTDKAVGALTKTNKSTNSRSSTQLRQTLDVATPTIAETVSQLNIKNSESFLKGLGYNVAKSIGLSDNDRRNILQRAISGGLMFKDEIVTFLEYNINLHKNQESFAEAVSKWMADLAYIKKEL